MSLVKHLTSSLQFIPDTNQNPFVTLCIGVVPQWMIFLNEALHMILNHCHCGLVSGGSTMGLIGA